MPDAPDTPKTITPKRRSFRPSAWTLVPAVIAIVLSTMNSLAQEPTGDPAELIGSVLGSFACPILTALLFGWLAFFLARRSNRAGNIVIVFWLSLLALGQASAWLTAGVRGLNADAFLESANEFQAAVNRVQDTLTPEIIASPAAATKHQADELRREAVAARTDLVRRLLNELADINDGYHEAFIEYEAALDEVLGSGSLEFHGCDTPCLEARRATYERFRDANQAVLDRINAATPRFKAALQDTDLDDSIVQTIINDFRAGMAAGPAMRMRKLDKEFAAIAIDMIDMLIALEGEWEVDPETGLMLLEEDDDIDRYNAMWDRIDEIGIAQDEIIASAYRSIGVEPPSPPDEEAPDPADAPRPF